MITQEILIDVNNHIAPEVVSRLGESNVRQLLIKPVFYNTDGTYTQIVIDSENVHGMFRMVKPDGTFVTTNMALATPSSDPAVFVVTLTGAMSQVAGRGYYDVRIGDTEDASEFIYSAQGIFTIDDDMLQNAVESVAEANGMVFPDDFLTSADLEDYVTDEELQDAIEDFATKEYVDDAIAEIPSPLHIYSETESVIGKWIDDSYLYERTFVFDNINASSTFATLMDITGLNIKTISGYASFSGVDADMYLNTLIDGNYNAIVYKDGNLLKYKTWYYGNTLDKIVVILQYTK